MGYSLAGAKNNPAPPEATGYEVDKLNLAHVESYLRAYLAPIAEAMGLCFGKSFQYLLVDSWEAGLQNWTEGMLAEFAKRRGYDARPYLPVLTGREVESAEVSERFLWDFRRTIADMLAEYHYARPAALLRQRGIKLYAEAAGTGSPMFQDALQNKGHVDIPTTSTTLTTVAGPWTVNFPANWGAPPQITLASLSSWTESAEAGVKHFSGTATYKKDLQVESAWLRPGARLMLDLGDVKELAEVSVNGRPVGILWTPPFRADVTGALQSGVTDSRSRSRTSGRTA